MQKVYLLRLMPVCVGLKRHGNEADFLAVPIFASNLRRYSYSKMTPRYHRYGESPTPRIIDTGSRGLPASLIHRVADTESQLLNFLKENSLYR